MSHREIFSKNLNRKMKEAGITRTDICDSLGFSYYTVTDWVKGKKMPRMDKIEKLAKYFGCLISDLIEEKTEEQREEQKKNDTLSDIIQKLSEDKELLDAVVKLSKLDVAKQIAVKNVIDAFSKVDN